jgi:hypothetical protein
MHEPITLEAHRLVTGDRNDRYDHPSEDFSITGRIWGALLHRWRDTDEADVPPELVGLMMVGLKMSRETYFPTRDNRVDGAGYWETVDMVHEHRAAPHQG